MGLFGRCTTIDELEILSFSYLKTSSDSVSKVLNHLHECFKKCFDEAINFRLSEVIILSTWSISVNVDKYSRLGSSCDGQNKGNRKGEGVYH